MINARALNKSDSRAGARPWDESMDDEYQNRVQQPPPQSPRPAVLSWAWWILSVCCTSFVFSNIEAFKLSSYSPLFSAGVRGGTPLGE
jgi:hypothetical protein